MPTEEQPLRVAQWDTLFAEHLREVPPTDQLRLRLELSGGSGVLEQVRDLAERESGCCSFFTFTTTGEESPVFLDVLVDAAHEPMLAALQAGAAVSAARP